MLLKRLSGYLYISSEINKHVTQKVVRPPISSERLMNSIINSCKLAFGLLADPLLLLLSSCRKMVTKSEINIKSIPSNKFAAVFCGTFVIEVLFDSPEVLQGVFSKIEV